MSRIVVCSNMSRVLLKSPETDAEWNAYHRIREEVLWEARGRFGVYDPNHPDEYGDGKYPKILVVDGEPVGVVRIDLEEESKEAIFRRVAIVEDEQRKGLGTALMTLSEEFATGEGYCNFAANVSEDAIGFYNRIGYRIDTDHPGNDPSNPWMIKKMRKQ